ncbi:helicase protein MOM1-like isoform X2 [Papaver somniferum]|uniref:helicase protein MOM1-like isoform X2 n=1 Tax=Papaver somniferum TaxID=3469 RepID=UPI000E6FBC4C|nr:helicase protein MOM1-like isoform X2 [Papaver somniferum]
MTKVTRSGRIMKGVNDESSSKQLADKGVTSGSPSTDTVLALRRSPRDTTPKKQSPASTPSTKNSERIEKNTPQTTPSKRKSERLEKLNMPSPLRRSDKDGRNHSLSVSGSKNSENSSSSLENRSKGEREKPEENTTVKSKDVKGNASKKLSAVKYRASLLKTQGKKDKNSDKKLKVLSDLPQGVSEEKGVGCSMKVEHGGHRGGVKVGEVREKLPSCLNTVELSGSKRIRLEMSSNSAPLDDGVICASAADPVLKAPIVTSPQNGEMSESCIRTDGSEKDIHAAPRRSIDNTETAEVCETLLEDQRKPALDQVVLPARTKNLVPSELEEDGRNLKARVCRDLAEECCTDVQLMSAPRMTSVGSGDNVCVSCKFGGTLLCCDGEGCKKSYHLKCLDPPLKNVPIGVWHCVFCVKKKVDSGVHSLSGGVGSILDAREVELADSEGVQKQYLVKYRCLAHVHNRWVPESQLLLEAPVLVGKFKKNQVVRWKPEWAVPQRLLRKRLLMSPKQRAEYLGDSHSDILCHFEWFVKWSGLGYDDATWELENEPFLRSAEALKLIKDYECRLEKAKMASDPTRAEKERRGSFFKLLELPGECELGLDTDHLCSVNKLREYWHKGQNAVFMEDQERVTRVILFILSLQPVVCRPFLIVSTTSALSAWEAEFLRLAPSLDVIVYSGSRDARKSIQMLEFYEEGRSVMFQVLLSSLDTIVEDIESLNCVSWEAIIVDECQLSKVSKSLENIKLLTTYFKLLLVNGPMKDSLVDYRHLLSFLGYGDDEEGISHCKNDSSDSIEKLKERLAWFVASERKSDSSKFVEYWVPVKLSSVQLEQYCYTLLSNSAFLRSCSKSFDTVELLRNVLISTRKCCDHPYLVDPTLQKMLTNGLPVTEYLNVGVKASGKLQVLDKILSEIKKQGLRVLILFQSIVGSGGISLGDFLDDVVRQRFGEDSYERVDGGLATSKKQAAMNKFNDKEKGRIVFLLERRACNPSIKLSSVDIVILYDSDWNPYNDLKVLQRITIDSRHEQLKLFRLYSSSTLEEKALIHAMQGMTFDSNLQNLNNSTIHMLLRWGASRLFKELKEFHDSSPSSGSIISSDQDADGVLNLVKELLGSLPQAAGGTSTNNSSIVVKVKQTGGIYSRDTCLPDELEMQSTEADLPHVFWSKLLERETPEWRYLSAASTSQRSRKRVQYFDGSPKRTIPDNDDVTKKRRKLVNGTADAATHRALVEDKRKIGGANKEGASGTPAGNGSHFLASPTVSTDAARFRNVNEISNVPACCMSEPEKRSKSLNAPKDLHIFSKPDISELCNILLFPENVSKMAGRFLEYIIDNNRVNQERVTLIQAFEISVCWIAASLLKHKLDRKETLKLAKQHLNFECTEEEVLAIYDMLRKKKKSFLRQTENVNQSTDEPARVTDNVKPHMHARAQSEMPGQQDLEGGAIRGTPQSQHSSNEFVPIKQLATDSEEANGSPNNEISKSISLVRKIHMERWLKLAAYQTKESKEFEEERVKIEKEQIATLDKVHKFESALIRRLHHQNSVRLEKLKKVDQDFNSKKDAIKNHMDAELKKLESLHLAAKNEETRLKHYWLREAKSGRSVDSFLALPQSLDSRFKLVTVQLNEQGPSKEPITGRDSSPRLNDLGVTGPSGTVRGESMVDCITPTERPDDFVKSTLQSTDPLQSVQSNDDTSVTQPNVQFQLEDLECCEQGPSEEPVDRTGSLKDSAMGDVGPSEIVRGHEPVTEVTIPTLPCDPSNDDSSVTDRIGSLRLTEMGVAQSPGTVRGHEPVVVDSITTDPLPCDRSEDATTAFLRDMQFPIEGSEISGQGPSKEPDVARTGSLGPSEVRVSEVPETISGYEQVVEGTLPAEQFPMTAPVNPPSAMQSELPAATVSPSDLLERNQSYNDNSVFSHAGPLQTAAPANPPGDPILANSSSHDTSVLPPALQLELPTLVETLPSEQSRVPTDPPVGSGTRVSDTRSMTSSRTSQSPLPQDPLCYELARIRKEEEQVVKIHKELKVRINSDYEKEMEEIHRKYNKLNHDADTALAQKKKSIDTNISKILMNRMLAEVFRFKCSETTRAAGPLGSQPGGHQGPLQNHQLFHSSQQNSQRSPMPPSSATTATPCTTIQSPVQVARQSSATFSSNNMPIRPHFSTGGALTSVSNQVGCRQSHAPHLQPFRPSTSMSASPSLQPPHNSSTLPVHLANLPGGSSSGLQVTGLPVNYGAGFNSSTYPSESAGTHNNSSLVIDTMMNDFDNFGLCGGGGSINPQNLLPPIQSIDQSDMFGSLNSSDLWGPATAAAQGEVVCLSDDE